MKRLTEAMPCDLAAQGPAQLPPLEALVRGAGPDGPRITLDRPEAVATFCAALLDCPQETFVWIGVDTRKQVVATQELFKGSVDACIVHPREIFRSALVLAPTVAGIFVVHNHPSGQCEPSAEDERFYQGVCDAGALLHIPVLDCLVVADDGFWSLHAGTVQRPSVYVHALPEVESWSE